MSELVDAVESADWPRALELALAIWRESRAIQVAELIEAIDLRLPRAPPPREKSRIKYWWRDRALRFETADLPTLLANVASAHGGAASWTELRERWVAALAAVAELLADRLSVLGDARVIPRLEAMIAEPRGALEATRTHQVQVARRIVTAIETRPAVPIALALAGELARCRALLVSHRITVFEHRATRARVAAPPRRVPGDPEAPHLELQLPRPARRQGTRPGAAIRRALLTDRDQI